MLHAIFPLRRHSGAGRNPGAGALCSDARWMPACAGMTVKRPRAAFALALLPLVAACSLAPKYERPEVPVAAAFKEAAADEAWQPAAASADQLPRGQWWAGFGDEQLNALAAKLEGGNPAIVVATSQYREAQALREQVISSLMFPTLSLGASSQRKRNSENEPPVGYDGPRYSNDYLASAQAGYETRLFSRVRSILDQSHANIDAIRNDIESLRLSLQADLVDNYIVLRALDAEALLLRDTVDAYQKAVELTATRHHAGAASGLDVARAQTQLQSAKVQAATLKAARAKLEHAIAILIGESPSNFAIEPAAVSLSAPNVPVGLPSTLLLRRADVAAAERRVAAANAGIGVARGAWFPTFSLGAEIGVHSFKTSNWFTAPSLFWAAGPSLAFSLLDGGARRAGLKQAHAEFDAASAEYRATALQAFAEVEDQLAQLTHYREASHEEEGAVDAAQRALDYAMTRYRAGAVNYLEVVTAQTAALDTQRGMLDLQTTQLRASVALIRAVGGGWNDSTATAAAENSATP